MKAIALATLAVVVVTGVSACGSSHGRYSIRQVEGAFASQGVPLRRAPKQVIHGFVVLQYGRQYGRRPHFVAVGVRVGQQPQGLQYYDGGSPGAWVTSDGNVIAIYDSGRSAAVKAALAELH